MSEDAGVTPQGNKFKKVKPVPAQNSSEAEAKVVGVDFGKEPSVVVAGAPKVSRLAAEQEAGRRALAKRKANP